MHVKKFRQLVRDADSHNLLMEFLQGILAFAFLEGYHAGDRVRKVLDSEGRFNESLTTEAIVEEASKCADTIIAQAWEDSGLLDIQRAKEAGVE